LTKHANEDNEKESYEAYEFENVEMASFEEEFLPSGSEEEMMIW